MKIFPILLSIVLFIGLFTPTVFAQDTGIAQLSGCTGLDCSACNVVSMANGLIIWLVGILFVVFALLLAIAGVRLVTSGGNHHALDEAKSSFMNAIIGFIIILAAWLIVDTIMRGLVGRPGQEGMIGGEATGWLFWSEIECSEQRESVLEDVVQEDVEAIPLYNNLSNAPGWTYVPSGGSGGGGGDAGSGGASGDTYTAQCPRAPGPAAEVSQYDCTNQRAQCTAQGGRATIIQSGRVLSCLVPPGGGGSGGGTIPTGIVTNTAMRPIFDPAQGGSSMVRSGAAARMQQTLSGPFARLQQNFGRSVMINDAIAKAGSSRERETPNSQHFYGTALDLSTSGMSNADKLRLFEAGRRAGFTGFGFGNNILHVDLGPSRGWAYGNATYGGRSVNELINSL
jgi:Type IV secretion system pilin/Peptidase M15